jgi:hypothetical protein
VSLKQFNYWNCGWHKKRTKGEMANVMIDVMDFVLLCEDPLGIAARVNRTQVVSSGLQILKVDITGG